MTETRTTPPAEKTGRRINELDLVRFITAFAVVLNHYTFSGPAKGTSPFHYPELSGATRYGFLGVEMFFLISGFVIPMSVRSGSLKKFLTSRIVRLYPAFWSACTLTFIAVVIWGHPTYSASFSQYLWNMTMLSAFFKVESIDAVYHTLFIEIVWYAIVAAALATGTAYQRARPTILLVTVPASLLIASGLTAGILGFEPLGTPAKAFCGAYWMYFIAGYIFYTIWSGTSRRLHLVVLLVCWLAALASSHRYVANVKEDVNVLVNPWILAILVTLCFAAMAMVATSRTPSFLTRRNWSSLGALTYPLYLVHQVIGMVIMQALASVVGRWTALVVTILAALCLAQLIHVLVEKPLTTPLRNVTNVVLDRLLPSIPAADSQSGRHRRITT